jgi:hypothetical protein
LAVRLSSSKSATDKDLLACCAACQALADPELGQKTPGALGHFLLRMGGQQLTFQQSYSNDLSRTVALLEQTSTARTLEAATSGWPERLLAAASGNTSARPSCCTPEH